MKVNLKTPAGRFRFVAFWEGISYLVLFANMLLVKPTAPDLYQTLLFPIGMAHGLLFILYILTLIPAWGEQKWSLLFGAWAFVASLLPFATFVVEKQVKDKK